MSREVEYEFVIAPCPVKGCQRLAFAAVEIRPKNLVLADVKGVTANALEERRLVSIECPWCRVVTRYKKGGTIEQAIIPQSVVERQEAPVAQASKATEDPK